MSMGAVMSPAAMPASPLVELSAPVFVHAPAHHGNSRLTVSPLASLTGWLTMPHGWLYDYTLDFDTMADALAQLIQRHPEYTSRIVDRTDGNYTIEMGNEGVPLSKGTSTLTLADLAPAFVSGGTEVRHPAFFEVLQDPHPLPVEQTISQRKALIDASIIALADGSTLIAVRFSHLLFDAAHVGMFMRDWADAVRGKFDGNDGRAAEDTAENFRALADPRNHIHFTGDVTGPNSTCIAFRSAEAFESMVGTLAEKKLECAYREFHFPADRIDVLAADLRRGDPRLSKNDCLTALIVKTIADNRAPGMMRAGFSVDLRMRRSPHSVEARSSTPMPVSLPPIDVHASSLLAIASAFRDAVLDDEAIGVSLGLLYAGFAQGHGARVCHSIDMTGTGPGSTSDIILSQWTRAGLYAPDFGKGTPRKFVCVADGMPTEPGGPNFGAVWQAPPGVGGAVLGITLYASEMELFKMRMAEFVAGGNIC
ncbi:hypothetical protein HKX48_003834 [Thoreauomyces humboldtii]|nr:hypothetical protein HKX48_003834 [Thoreauomyces humboldtii]